MKATPIPTSKRTAVRRRDRDQCVRCGGAGAQWHHRRRRGVRAGHDPHCTCIGVWLCVTCHGWAHANPAEARDTGFIVSAYEEEPWMAPLKSFNGWRTHDCEGGMSWA